MGKILDKLQKSMPTAKPAFLQVAALCHRPAENADGFEILLIKTQGRGRWIIPKGWPMERLPAWETAAQEAFEEAGIVGAIGRETVGSFTYSKTQNSGMSMNCEAEVFSLAVTGQETEYPEAGMREFQWLDPKQAAALVDDPELSELILSFRPTVG